MREVFATVDLTLVVDELLNESESERERERER